MSKTFQPWLLPLPLLLLLAALTLVPPASWSQPVPRSGAAGLSRGPLKMDRDEFLRSHHWDPKSDVWLLNSGVEPPAGVMPRVDVKAARDTYLSTHRWDASQGWLPLKSGRRNMSALTRDQVQAETRQFLRTHRWDEATEEWALKAARSGR